MPGWKANLSYSSPGQITPAHVSAIQRQAAPSSQVILPKIMPRLASAPNFHRGGVVQGSMQPGYKLQRTMTSTRAAIQAKSQSQISPGVDAFQVNLQPKSGGLALPDAVRTKMEYVLGADFSDVRVHVGSEAANIGAIAFTWGSDIHFAPGHYNPNTFQGQQLLGHELTHVVQQRSGRVRNPFGNGTAVVQDTLLEAEADRMGLRAATTTVPPMHLG